MPRAALRQEQLRLGLRQQQLHGLRVPAAIVERDVPALAERAPVFLHQREVAAHTLAEACELGRSLRIRIGRHMHARSPSVEVVHQVGYPRALPRAVPALEQHHQPRTRRHRALLEHH